MFFNLRLFSLCFFLWSVDADADECQFLTMCKCTNFPLFALIDTGYLAKPRSVLNQDLFCTYSSELLHEAKLSTFEQFKYFRYRFRTLTFANYPLIPTNAFRFVYFESQSVKQTHRTNNRNVIAFVNIEQTQSGIFDELSLPDAHDQLILSFLNSPSLTYATGALSNLNCYELKLQNTNPKIPIDFFAQTISIHHLIIDNPSFTGFLPSSAALSFQLAKLSIKDISARSLQGKHFPIVFNTVAELTLENYRFTGGFRSFDSRELARCFPQVRRLKLFSRSIQHIIARLFEHFNQLEYLTLNGITAVENEAFFGLHHLKELYLGKDLRRLDPYAFLHMSASQVFLNDSVDFPLDDDKHFCVFAQFSPVPTIKTFVKYPPTVHSCSCTIRYAYRHLDKSFMSMTPACYSNSSLYILAQEERLCYFEQRLLQCHVLPDDGITIYGKHYNVSHFYQQQLFKQRNQWKFFYRYRVYFLTLSPVAFVAVCLIVLVVRQKNQRNGNAYRHLNRLLKRRRLSRNETTTTTVDIIYHRTNAQPDLLASTIPISTKV